MDRNSPIGFFDSGMGGISVLRETIHLMPCENYLYYGDSLHAPYGVRTQKEVQVLSEAAALTLMQRDVKAIVVACNTATSASIDLLREKYPNMIFVGTEPALKPAVAKHPGGRILVMATAMTLKEQKFSDLWNQYRNQAEIVPVPCTGLMEFVEQGILRGEKVEAYLVNKLSPFLQEHVDAVVLGCTHYPFLRGELRKLMGCQVDFIDSGDGVARQLRRILEERNLLRTVHTVGEVEFTNSLDSEEILDLSRHLLVYKND